MSFNSFEFFGFFLVVLLLLRLTRRENLRQILLLLASYVFYMAWKPGYALLLLFVTLANFYLAKGMNHTKGNRLPWLWASLFCNFSLLAFFKYFNFFAENLNGALSLFDLSIPRAEILLPVGISFFTFQAQSYTLDVYFKVIPVESSFRRFALYVSFFPQLVAGPVVKARDFLPQLHQKRVEPAGADIGAGIQAILVGLFLKVVIADNLAYYTLSMSAPSYEVRHSLNLLILSWAFMSQVFCDFAGYSSIAIGCAKLMGYKLPTNFNYPLLALGFADFWKRWHISLTSWFRDYVFLRLTLRSPLKNKVKTNLMITMLLSGLWHGAAWGMIIWGGLHGLYYVAELTFQKVFPRKKRPSLFAKLFHWFFTFNAVCFAVIFFYHANLEDALGYTRAMLWENRNQPLLLPRIADMLFFLFLLFCYHLPPLLRTTRLKGWTESALARGIAYAFLLLALMNLWAESSTFIYFQF